tara:strand:- start:303 stop:842 length:540 start_codon:yes stop_codon:yes gene_type:complete
MKGANMYKQNKPNGNALQPMKYLPMLSQSNQELAIRRMHERSWLETNEHLIQYIDFEVANIKLINGKFYWQSKPNTKNLEVARSMVSMAFVPLPFDDLQEALYAMQLRLVTTLKTETGMRKRANTIATDLHATPVDVFLSVCKSIQETETYFPAIKTFIERIEPRMKTRFALKELLHMK